MAIKPIYWSPPLRPGERPLFALTPEDYEKVRQGYGCPECLEDFYGVYMLQCPVCKHIRRDGEVQAAPIEWQQHVDELNTIDTSKSRTVTPDEFIESVMRDPDIEHRKL